jgi:hypothetical protein
MMLDSPVVVFVVALVFLWVSAQAGAFFRRKQGAPDKEERQDLGVVLAASLTLLGLVIGFSFSMAVTRYDHRKTSEEDEAYAIGTEFWRAGLLPPAQSEMVRALLAAYLDQRVSFFSTSDARRLQQIDAQTGMLQGKLWSVVEAVASLQATPITALVVSGLNDVFNSQGYTQAAWWNRIPGAAWTLVAAIAVFCNFLFGYAARHSERRYRLFVVLPVIVAISFFLISDLDSPRGGVIHVSPRNLMSLSHSISSVPAIHPPLSFRPKLHSPHLE